MPPFSLQVQQACPSSCQLKPQNFSSFFLMDIYTEFFPKSDWHRTTAGPCLNHPPSHPRQTFSVQLKSV